jgi:hypothetical protein
MQVPYEMSWAHRLEEGLGPEWEVLNAGVAGYGTDNELLYLRERGLALNPDLVLLLFFTGNDVSDNDHDMSLRIGGVEAKPYFFLDEGRLYPENFPLPIAPGGFSAAMKNILRDHSRLYLLIRTRKNLLETLARQRKAGGNDAGSPAGNVPLAWHVYRNGSDPEWERAWQITSALLLEIRRTLDEHRVRFLMASLPTGWRIEPSQRDDLTLRHPSMADASEWDFDLPDRRLSAIADSAGIPSVSLTGPLLAARRTEDRPLYGDHLSVEGHRLVAGELVTFVRSHADSLPGAGRLR